MGVAGGHCAVPLAMAIVQADAFSDCVGELLRLWREMTTCGGPLRVAAISELAGVSEATVRKHLRQWVLAGYVEENIVKLPGRQRIQYVAEYEIGNWCDTAPPITWQVAAKLVHVTDPDNPDRYTIIIAG